MANDRMNFGVDLLPISTNTYNLGDADHKWKINGETPVLTDTKVTQTLTNDSTDAYPILFTNTESPTSPATDGVRYTSNIKIIPKKASLCFSSGANSTNIGNSSIAIGKAQASGVVSYARGGVVGSTYTDGAIASGSMSTAIGANSKAFGNYSLSFGFVAEATGNYSVAVGSGVKAEGTSQTVIGKCNKIDNNNNYVFIIGNGSDPSSRSNAMTVDWGGNLSVGGGASFAQSPTAPTPSAGDNSTKLATTEFVSGAIANLNNITGSGTAGSLAKFDGNRSIIAGPAINANGIRFLKEDGSWATPTDTTYSAGAGISLSNNIFSNSGVHAVSINGNYLKVNTNGTNANLTIPYATNATNDEDGNKISTTYLKQIPVATSTTLGGIKINYTTFGNNYAVQLELDSQKAYVNVPWTDTKVTSVTNHYTPSRDTNADKTASASGATAAWDIDVVKGVTLETDGKGHVTGISVTSGKIPSNPNVDTKVRQTLTSDSNNLPLLMAGVAITTTTTNSDAKAYRNNNIYANPSTGLITAPKLNLTDDTDSTSISTGSLIVAGGIGCAQSIYATSVWGAVWNDYAEFRKDNVKEKELQQPGRCVREVGDGTLTLTDGRLQRGCEIISDTFGFAIGQDKEKGYNTPIASSGRVLAYLYEDRELARNFIGWPVCSGPDGTVSIMTEEEENRYSNRIVGTISEIPDYEEWGTGKVKVNGRIWIRIK